jgi:hypothetical protein
MKMIERKHFVGVGTVRVPLPVAHDPGHHIAMTLMTQNDLKTNRGLNVFKISDVFRLRGPHTYLVNTL